MTTRIASVASAVAAAKTAEDLGFDGIGVADTAPLVFQALYPTVTSILLSTRRIMVAPHLTNLVSQHWSVHASTARAFAELAPGRFMLGVATGDGAVRSVGLSPATWQRFEREVGLLRQAAPSDLRIQVAASGDRGAAAAARIADDVIFGGGFDAPSLNRLGAVADDVADEAGLQHPRRWLTIPMCVVADEDQRAAARAHLRGVAVLTAHFAFSKNLGDRNIPERWHSELSARLAQYEYSHHGALGNNHNAELFSDLPELEDYLLDRMVLVGTVNHCRRRLTEIVELAGLDGVYIGPHLPPGETDTRALLARIAEASCVHHPVRS